MKRFLLLVAVMFVSLGAFAQSGPKIQFKTETIDYGTTNKEDDNGLRVFEFTNTGDAPLIITDVKSSCGCTVPSKPKDPIQPGATGKIEVKYNMHTGPIRKSIAVMTNAVNVPEGNVTLKITGEVIDPEKVDILQKKKTMMDQ